MDKQSVLDKKVFFMNNKDKLFNFTVSEYDAKVGGQKIRNYRGWGIWRVGVVQEGPHGFYFALEIVSPKGKRHLICSHGFQNVEMLKN